MFKEERVKIVNIDLPSPCNLNCEFCYLPKTEGILNPDDLEEIIKGFSNAQIFNLGGGEPFLNNNLISVIEYIESLGDKRMVITTNATHIPEKILELPEKTRNKITIQVSLPAGNSRVYKDITEKDEFDSVLQNTKELKKHYNTIINTAVYQKNYESLDGILKIAQEMEIIARINLAIPVGKGKNIKIINEKQLKKLKSFLLVKKALGFAIESPLLSTSKDNCTINGCIALESFYNLKKEALCFADFGIKAYIDPDGNKFDCEYLAYSTNNILAGAENG